MRIVEQSLVLYIAVLISSDEGERGGEGELPDLYH